MTSWIDSVGDSLETFGVASGNLFEGSGKAGQEYNSGFILATTKETPQGKHPQTATQVAFLYLFHKTHGVVLCTREQIKRFFPILKDNMF